MSGNGSICRANARIARSALSAWYGAVSGVPAGTATEQPPEGKGGRAAARRWPQEPSAYPHPRPVVGPIVPARFRAQKGSPAESSVVPLAEASPVALSRPGSPNRRPASIGGQPSRRPDVLMRWAVRAVRSGGTAVLRAIHQTAREGAPEGGDPHSSLGWQTAAEVERWVKLSEHFGLDRAERIPVVVGGERNAEMFGDPC